MVITNKRRSLFFSQDMSTAVVIICPIDVLSVILSTWRSGSSFLGDILNSIPRSYYFYEPLRHLGEKRIREASESKSVALRELHQLLKCNFTGNEKYLDSVIGRYNFRQFTFCSAFKTYGLCRKPNFVNAFCSVFPIQTIKEVRLQAALSEPLLLDSDLNVKIVLLIRDPRGTVTSRKRERWCYMRKDCGDYTKLCQDMISDFQASQYLTDKYPLRFKVIRYEDLSLNPFKKTKEILDFFELPFHENIKQFLRTHTIYSDGNSMSRFRESKNTALSWLHHITSVELNQTQSECGKALDLWGYRKVNTKNELNGNFYPLLPFPFDDEYSD